MREHTAETKRNRPAQYRVHDGATRKLELDSIGESRSPRPSGFELMTMDPLCERALDLFVHKQSILLVLGMQRDPAHQPGNPKLYARSDPNSLRAPHDPYRREGRGQQRQCIRALMEPEDGFDWRVDQYTPDEGGHAFSLVSGGARRSDSAMRHWKRR